MRYGSMHITSHLYAIDVHGFLEAPVHPAPEIRCFLPEARPACRQTALQCQYYGVKCRHLQQLHTATLIFQRLHPTRIACLALIKGCTVGNARRQCMLPSTALQVEAIGRKGSLVGNYNAAILYA